MAHVHVLLKGQAVADLGIASPHHADVFFLEQQLVGMAVDDVALRHDHQVDLAANQQFTGIVARAEHLERDVRRFLVDFLNHLGKQHTDQVIRGHKAEVTFAGRGVEHRLGGD
ncbi:hypothetical protein D3C73_1352710 [compost metagenome]